MKVKKISSALAVAACLLFFSDCKKPEPNVEPEADMETQSAIDAIWATYVVTDIDQICAFMAENQLDQHFYTSVAGSGPTTPDRDSAAKYLKMGYNKTLCIDGRVRDGSIFMNYKPHLIDNPRANPNSNYYRDFGFAGRITLSEYKVDGWLIKLYNDLAPAYVYNTLTTHLYDPKTVQLTWSVEGKFLMRHPTDSMKNIVWDGKLKKTLINSTNPKVFAVTKQSSINWSLAKVKYSGPCEGMTSKTIPWKMEIDPVTPLIRDFQCFPDKISSVATTTNAGMVAMRFEEHHPFVSGVASFTTGTAEEKIYPRLIYLGDATNVTVDESKVDQPAPPLPQNPPQWPCDNTGQILIKGVSYKVNFRK